VADIIVHEPHCPVPRARARGEGAVCQCRATCPREIVVTVTKEDMLFRGSFSVNGDHPVTIVSCGSDLDMTLGAVIHDLWKRGAFKERVLLTVKLPEE
jgi:hypothetical protein